MFYIRRLFKFPRKKTIDLFFFYKTCEIAQDQGSGQRFYSGGGQNFNSGNRKKSFSQQYYFECNN